MTPLEVFAIIVLGGAVLLLLYYYLQDNRNLNFNQLKSQASNLGDKVSGEGLKSQASNLGNKVSGEGLNISGVSEKVTGMSEKLRGKVREVPISTDVLSDRIEDFLDEQSEQLIKDWDLATKKDVSQLEKRYETVSIDLDALEGRFNEFRGFTNKKLDNIDERLNKIENPEEK
jgi:hypothetical protein